jgi:antitoxin component YwqK of YwqJK toxin-antitoxin module
MAALVVLESAWVITKNTYLINKNDTLKVVSIGKEDGSLCESLSWKNNKRNGIGNYFFDSGTSKVKYVNGAKIYSVFQTYKDINGIK